MTLNPHCLTLVAMITLIGSLAGRSQPHPEATAKPAQNTTAIPAQKPALRPGEIWENAKDGLKYVWIPPGTFTMGCSPGDSECDAAEKPSHQVELTKGFWMGQTEVTARAYQRFAAATGRQMPSAPAFNAGWRKQNMPIGNVTWDEAQAYCEWSGGRLPTEAEWEYAARAGSTEARYGPLDQVAWFADRRGPRAHDAAQKQANAFGLYDMLGNVWEWVNDRYDANYYQNSPSQDPPGPSTGRDRVLRGGSWVYGPRFIRVSYRRSDPPRTYDDSVGLRCVGQANSP